MVVGIKQTSSDTSTNTVCGGTGVNCERLKRHHGQQKNNRQPGQQNIERDFIGSLLPLCSFDQRDHAIHKSLARIAGDLDLQPVRQHARAAGHRRSVSAGFTDYRRGLAGDGGFIHRCHAFEDFSITRNELTRR